MNKFSAIRTILKAHNYIVITEKGHHTCTPKFGHKEYWQKATDMFEMLKKKADKLNEQ